jgi:hypothetical protein
MNCGICGAAKPGGARSCSRRQSQLNEPGSDRMAAPDSWPPASPDYPPPTPQRPRSATTVVAVVPMEPAAPVAMGWPHRPPAVFGSTTGLAYTATAASAPGQPYGKRASEPATAISGSATVGGAAVSGSEALVVVTGSMCADGSCQSNSDASAGMTNSRESFVRANDQGAEQRQ